MSRVSCATGEPPLLRQVGQRPHVVQPIGQLDQDDADVVDHREQHLAEVLRLPLLARREPDRADLGDALDHVGDLGPEELLDALDRRQGVLDDVVQQPGGDRDGVELHVGQEIGHGERMDQVGLARVAHLAPVLEGREHIGPPEQLDVGSRAVGPDLFEEILEANHEFRCLTVCRMDGWSVIGSRRQRNDQDSGLIFAPELTLTYVFLLHYTCPVSGLVGGAPGPDQMNSLTQRGLHA